MFGNDEQVTYVTPFNGKFTIRVAPDHPKAIEHVTKTGSKIYYLAYEYVEGHITGLNYKERQHEGLTYRTVEIKMVGKAGTPAVLQLNLKSRAVTGFFQVMESIDFEAPVKIKITRKDDADALFVEQHESYLKWSYTKDNPSDCPPMVKMVVNGDEVWDSTDRNKFFLGKLNELAVKLKGHSSRDIARTESATTQAQADPYAAAGAEYTPDNTVVIEDDDLPF